MFGERLWLGGTVQSGGNFSKIKMLLNPRHLVTQSLSPNT